MGKVKILVAVSLLSACVSLAKGQKGVEDGSKYGHGEDSIECTRNYSIYRDFVRQGNYSIAFPYWKKAFNDCPLASKNIFLDGVKIYKYLLDGLPPEAENDNLLDTLILIYDRRIRYFGETANVRGRQGIDLLRYGRNETEKIQRAYTFLKEAIQIDKISTSEPVLASYVSSSIILYQNNLLETNITIDDYLLVSNLIDQKMIKNPSDTTLIGLKTAIDGNFIEQGPGNCDTLISYFSEEIKNKKDNIAFLRMLTSLLRNRNCTDSELFFTASKYLQTLAPSTESASNIAILAYRQNAFSLAVEYYQQALNLETDEDKKADYLFGLAACYNGLGNKIKARELALKSSEIRPLWGEPYLLIGQMYADSKDECSSITLPGSIYWAAIDKFLKAKTVDPSISERANSQILTYSRYFPDKEKAFFENVLEGSSFTVGCWINETTQARFNN